MSNTVVLTPAAVNKYLKSIIEGDKFLKYFLITGEISNFKRHSSGTLYFSIKDNEATISCSMWPTNAKNIDFDIKEGDKVEITASIFLNVKTGYYSLNVSKMKLDGEGDLYQKFLKLKNDLNKKGYFDQNSKKEIVKVPKRIGVVTSPTSAAVRDIITTIKRRYPICEVIIIPTLVQGSSAAMDIAKNINRAQSLDLDVLIVGRGGGSIEDLWSFNEEIVADATYNSKVPIISCVGHETDTTIIDYVADMRAPTPTAAAELATPDIKKLRSEVSELVKIISDNLNNKIKIRKVSLDSLVNNQYFENPLFKATMEFDQLNMKFIREVNNLNISLLNNKNKLDTFENSILEVIKTKQNNYNLNLEKMSSSLDELNPLTILSRGFSVSTFDNKVIKKTSDIKLDDSIKIQVVDGVITTKVIDIKKENNE